MTATVKSAIGMPVTSSLRLFLVTDEAVVTPNPAGYLQSSVDANGVRLFSIPTYLGTQPVGLYTYRLVVDGTTDILENGWVYLTDNEVSDTRQARELVIQASTQVNAVATPSRAVVNKSGPIRDTIDIIEDVSEDETHVDADVTPDADDLVVRVNGSVVATGTRTIVRNSTGVYTVTWTPASTLTVGDHITLEVPVVLDGNTKLWKRYYEAFDTVIQLTVPPFVGHVPNRQSRTTLKVYYNEIIDLTVTLLDASGALVDGSGWTKKLVIESEDGTDLMTLLDADITMPDDNHVIFRVDRTVTALVDQILKWSLRDIASGLDVIKMYGPLVVEYAAYDN